MSRRNCILFFLLVGSVLGALSGILLGRFVPNCGDPCGSERFARVLLGVGAGATVFFLASYVWPQRAQTPSSFFRRLAVACTVLGIGTLVGYAYQVETQHAYLQGIREIQPSADFSTIAIAKQEIIVYESIEPSSLERFRIAKGERCALASEGGAPPPSRLEIHCKRGTGAIDANQLSNLLLTNPLSK